MIEDWFSIPASDGQRIYYILNQESVQKAVRCVILAHGLTGDPVEAIHQVATQHFLSKGYDVYRIAFYSYGDSARNLKDCTLAIHASDLNQLVAHIAKDYARVFVAGHSYGGLTTLLANPGALSDKVRGLAFWDSSYVPEFWEEAVYVPETNNFKIGWGVWNEIGRDMVDEGRRYTRDYARALARKIKTPAAVMLAGKGQENADETALYDDLSCAKEIFKFDDASHRFWETGQSEKLAEATEAFFSRIDK